MGSRAKGEEAERKVEMRIWGKREDLGSYVLVMTKSDRGVVGKGDFLKVCKDRVMVVAQWGNRQGSGGAGTGSGRSPELSRP